MNKLLTSVYWITMFVIVQACNKPSVDTSASQSKSELVDAEGVESKDGVLAFNSVNSFNSFLQQYSNSTEDEVLIFEKKKVYKSAYSIRKVDKAGSAMRFSGALGIALNDRSLVVIGDSLYSFDKGSVRSASLRGSSLSIAEENIERSRLEKTKLVRIVNAESSSVQYGGQSSNARAIASGETRSTVLYDRGKNTSYHSVAGIFSTIYSVQGGKIVTTNLRLTARLNPGSPNNNADPNYGVLNTCGGTTQRAYTPKAGSSRGGAGNLELVVYVNGGLNRYTFTFDTGDLSGGEVSTVVYSSPIIDDPNGNIRTSSVYWEGKFYFSSSQIDCILGGNQGPYNTGGVVPEVNNNGPRS